ncbi:hypothetical protein [uncultured Microbulbifer sp.]|uniref:hypothetical protein n=1 Tax=uncultured Microbulbifer sp. TaxID=348147 RepID=UPI002613BC57|nr:hypothetical protein [uncultured Microbulbifer sp.]
MLNFFYFRFYALSQKVNGIGGHNHYYACLSLSFFEIALLLNGVLLVHIFIEVGAVFPDVSKFLAVVIFLVVFLANFIIFSMRNRDEEFLAERKRVLCSHTKYIDGILSLLIPILCMFSLAYFLI